MSFFSLLWKIIHGFFETHVVRANDALEERDWLTVVLHLAVVIIVGAVGVVVPIFLVYKFRHLILAIATPIIILAVLIASFFENRKTPGVSSPPPADIDTIRTRAKATYPTMKQTAYLLFRDLCRYLPGLVAPFSTSAVVAPVCYDITASFVTLFHFIIVKGEADVAISTIKEILENLIDQRLRAQDLPLSVPAVYTAADGSTWPGLIVDGIYDIGRQYRVDLVITNEAEVARLQVRGLNSLDGETGAAAPLDPDFD